MTDASYALSDYIQTLDNLPAELQHIYEELSTKERLFLKYKREKDAREGKIFRHIRENGAHVANPFEDKYNSQIEEIFVKMDQIQEEKCILADKAKELMDRHMNRLNLEIKRLEEDGQIIPLPSTNPPSETNGTSTPNGTPTIIVPTVTAPSVVTVAPPTIRAPLPQRTASSTGLVIPSGSALGTPTPSSSGIRTSQKRKANTAFRRDSSVDEIAADEDSQVYCFCQQVSFGEMVACDNENCEREWFHLPCVGLTSPPQGKWFCDECLAKMAAQKQRQAEKKKIIK